MGKKLTDLAIMNNDIIKKKQELHAKIYKGLFLNHFFKEFANILPHVNIDIMDGFEKQESPLFDIFMNIQEIIENHGNLYDENDWVKEQGFVLFCNEIQSYLKTEGCLASISRKSDKEISIKGFRYINELIKKENLSKLNEYKKTFNVHSSLSESMLKNLFENQIEEFYEHQQSSWERLPNYDVFDKVFDFLYKTYIKPLIKNTNKHDPTHDELIIKAMYSHKFKEKTLIEYILNGKVNEELREIFLL